ncbi:hypothetical protein LCGC14_2978420, partial [marine sediment metagenome]
SKQLWQLMLDAEIELARRGSGSAETYQKLLSRVSQASTAGMLSPYLADYYNGVLYERLGKHRQSLSAYENALSRATTPKDRIRAQSKVSELRIQIAMASG